MTTPYTTLYDTQDERVADWIMLCPLPVNPVIIDIGERSGAVTTALARLAGRVFVVNNDSAGLAYISSCVRNSGQGNVTCIHSDPSGKCPLPFRDATADLVVMNGTLERAGTAGACVTPGARQAALLSEAHRVLRRDGCLYIGMASWPGRLFAMGHGTGTLSARAVRSMLLAAGFAKSAWYAPLPSYRNPRSIVPIDNAPALRGGIVKTGIPRLRAALLVLSSFVGTQRYMMSDYSIIARK